MTHRSPSVAVVGVGAIGTVAAASLFARGLRPLLCVRRRFDALEVVGPSGTEHHDDLDLASDPGTIEPRELVVLATKAHQTDGAADWLRALSTESTTVMVIQNGVEHEARVRRHLPEGAKVVPAIIDVPADRSAPGRISVRRSGALRVPDDAAGRRAIACFGVTNAIEKAEAVADFDQVLWRKLAVNVVSGAIPALTDRTAEVFREPAVQAVARSMVEECVTVARGLGVPVEASLVDEVIQGFLRADPHAVTSMLRDRREGRRLESDARNGAVVRAGRRLGIPTPYNETAAALLGALNPP